MFRLARSVGATVAPETKVNEPGSSRDEEHVIQQQLAGLFGDNEIDVRPYHRLISHSIVPPISPEEVNVEFEDVRKLLMELR